MIGGSCERAGKSRAGFDGLVGSDADTHSLVKGCALLRVAPSGKEPSMRLINTNYDAMPGLHDHYESKVIYIK
jgi:hypothetical protein